MNTRSIILRIIKPFAEKIYSVQPENVFFWIVLKVQIIIEPILKDVDCINDYIIIIDLYDSVIKISYRKKYIRDKEHFF